MHGLHLQPSAAATNTDTMNVNGGRSVTYRYGGESGILTQPLSYPIISRNSHVFWRFL